MSSFTPNVSSSSLDPKGFIEGTRCDIELDAGKMKEMRIFSQEYPLTPELLFRIFEFLPLDFNFSTMPLVSKHIKNLVYDPVLIKRIIEANFNEAERLGIILDGSTEKTIENAIKLEEKIDRIKKSDTICIFKKILETYEKYYEGSIFEEIKNAYELKSLTFPDIDKLKDQSFEKIAKTFNEWVKISNEILEQKGEERSYLVDLSANNLSYLPKGFFELKSLTLLNLTNNKIKNLPDLTSIYNNTVRCIQLDDNKLQEFPKNLKAHFPFLSKLFISGNNDIMRTKYITNIDGIWVYP